MQNIAECKENGFTLVEVLVAMAILALSLAVILSALSTAMRSTLHAADAAEATEVAQSLLAREEASLPLQYGETSGVTTDGDLWHVDVGPWVQNDEPRQIGAYRIVISVARNGYTVSVSTLLAGPIASAP